MKVLVVYATRHGATAGIADRIADTLTAAGHDAVSTPVEQVTDLDDYAAVVLGGAAYMFHWLKPAGAFARRHHAVLATKPLWLFSSGPLGPDEPDAQGNDPRTTTRPKEWKELIELLHPRGERVFFGAFDPSSPPIGWGERIFRHLPAGSSALPPGDFRDWQDIDGWASEIATALAGSAAP